MNFFQFLVKMHCVSISILSLKEMHAITLFSDHKISASLTFSVIGQDFMTYRGPPLAPIVSWCVGPSKDLHGRLH